MSDAPHRLLLVEDDDDHAELFRLAFPDREIRHVRTAEAALDALRDAGSPPPDLVVLDLKLPGHDGLHVLREVRADLRLAGLSVAVLTTSRAERDRLAVAEIGADAYYEKPMGGEDFDRLRERIDDWWPRWRARSA